VADTLDKTLKFGFDPAMLQASSRHIAALKREVEGLAKVLGPLSQMLGWAPASGSSAGGQPGKAPATPRPTSTPATAMNQRLMESRSFFAAMASSSKTALQGMTRALQTESSAQERAVAKLRSEVGKLAATYGALSAAAGRGQPVYSDMGALRSQMYAGMKQLGDAQQAYQSVRRAELQAAALGGQGKWGARAELLRQDLGGIGERYAGMMGVGPTTMQYGGAAVLGAVIGKTIWNSMKSGMQEAQQAPHDFLSRAMTGNTPYAHAALAVKHGDLGLMQAYRLIQSNEVARRSFEDLARGGSRAVSGFEKSVSGGVSFDAEGWRRTQAAIAGGWEAFKMNPVGGLNQAMRGIGNIPSQMTGEQMAYIQRFREAFPLMFEAHNQFQQNAMADVGAMRALGMGADRQRSIIMQQKGTGAVAGVDEWKTNNALRLLRGFENRGISRGEALSAFGQIEGAAGLGTAQRLVGLGVQGQIGHLGGAGGILGAAAMTGDASAFWSNLTNLVGRGAGGMDVGAASLYGQTAAGAMLNGAAPTNGLGVLGAMTQFARGGNAAEDVFQARFAGAGLAGIGRISQGRVDPYQSGTNLLSAIAAGPGLSVGAQETLAQIDPRLMIDIMGGAPIPAHLRVQGITKEMVQQYGRSIMARTYDRAISATSNQNGQLDAVQRQTQVVRGRFGGSFGDYFRSLGKGEQAEAISARGAFLTQTGLAESAMVGESMARIEAGIGSYGTMIGGKRTPGRGIGDAAAGSNELALEAQKSRFQGELERERENMPSLLAADIKNMQATATTFGNVANKVGIAVDEVSAELKKLAQAISETRAQIVVSGGRMGPR